MPEGHRPNVRYTTRTAVGILVLTRGPATGKRVTRTFLPRQVYAGIGLRRFLAAYLILIVVVSLGTAA